MAEPIDLSALSLRLVEWVDSTGGSAWRPARDAAEERPSTCITVGWVIYESDEHVSLVQSLDPSSGHVSGEMLIPKAVVVRSYDVTDPRS